MSDESGTEKTLQIEISLRDMSYSRIVDDSEQGDADKRRSIGIVPWAGKEQHPEPEWTRGNGKHADDIDNQRISSDITP
jgi:hypothetical protein